MTMLRTGSVKPGNRRDSGVPDVAYTYYAELLIAVGYKTIAISRSAYLEDMGTH
jgi:hypothetical protein